MFDLTNMLSGGFYTLKTAISATEVPGTFIVNIYPAPKYQTDDGAGGITETFITDAPFSISPNIIDSSRVLQDERVWFSDGEEQSDGSANYKLFKRGRINTWLDNPATDSYSDNYKAHKIGAVVQFDHTGLIRGLYNTFIEATTAETVTVGEDIDTTASNLGVSIHTDGKYYKYHNVNYPNYQGVIKSGQTLLADETATLYNLKSIVTGFTSLGNSFVYVDNGGTFTTTSSATTTLAGIARDDTVLVNAERAPSSPELTQVQVEDDTSTVFGTVSGERLGQANTLLGEVKSFAVSISGALSVATLQGKGWAVCDGTTPASQGITSPTITANTPNLVDKFIRGDASASGATGGADTVTLTEAQMPSHDHGIGVENTGNANAPLDTGNSFGYYASDGSQLGHTNSPNVYNSNLIDDAGSDQAHENKPPYYELVFMIKVK